MWAFLFGKNDEDSDTASEAEEPAAGSPSALEQRLQGLNITSGELSRAWGMVGGEARCAIQARPNRSGLPTPAGRGSDQGLGDDQFDAATAGAAGHAEVPGAAAAAATAAAGFGSAEPATQLDPEASLYMYRFVFGSSSFQPCLVAGSVRPQVSSMSRVTPAWRLRVEGQVRTHSSAAMAVQTAESCQCSAGLLLLLLVEPFGQGAVALMPSQIDLLLLSASPPHFEFDADLLRVRT